MLSLAGNAGYWEVVELGRKLILSGLLGLVGRGSIAQSVAGVMIAFVFFALTFKERPYKSNSLNWIKIFSEFQIFAVLLICVVLQTLTTDFGTEHITVDDYGLLQCVCVVAMFPIAAYFIFDSVRDLDKRVASDEEPDDSKDIEDDVESKSVFESEDDEEFTNPTN